MTPDAITRIRAYLDRAGPGMPEGFVQDVNALLAALPPDRGGAMPEPWPGMLVQDRDGDRWPVTRVRPTRDGWLVFGAGEVWDQWDEVDIHEIRTPDGRVLWRASAAG
jgi:hypothetical protein